MSLLSLALILVLLRQQGIDKWSTSILKSAQQLSKWTTLYTGWAFNYKMQSVTMTQWGITVIRHWNHIKLPTLFCHQDLGPLSLPLPPANSAFRQGFPVSPWVIPDLESLLSHSGLWPHLRSCLWLFGCLLTDSAPSHPNFRPMDSIPSPGNSERWIPTPWARLSVTVLRRRYGRVTSHRLGFSPGSVTGRFF